jgi:hypothetical protein
LAFSAASSLSSDLDLRLDENFTNELSLHAWHPEPAKIHIRGLVEQPPLVPWDRPTHYQLVRRNA